MGKRGRILVAVMALVVAGVVGWSIFRARSGPPDPLYKGRPLSYWLQGYKNFTQSTNLPGFMGANTAVREAGTNAIPLLLQMLNAPDAPRNTTLWRWVFSIPYVRHHYTFPGGKNLQAFYAFDTLGRDAAPAVPGLVRILNENSNSNTILYSTVILGGIGPAAADAVPVLLRIATGTNQRACLTAIGALGQVHCHPDTVVPALITLLHDPSAEIRTAAAAALMGFGADARPAVPVLVEIISERDGRSNSVPVTYPLTPANPSVHSMAEQALRMIDPETYARVVTNKARIRSP